MVVADLEAYAVDRFDNMQILVAVNPAKDDVSDRQLGGIHGADRTELTGFDPGRHGVAARPKRDALTGLKLRDVKSSPTHDGRQTGGISFPDRVWSVPKIRRKMLLGSARAERHVEIDSPSSELSEKRAWKHQAFARGSEAV